MIGYNEYIKFFITAIILLATDSLYLTSVSTHFNNVVRGIQGTPIILDMTSTILCYIFLVLGLYYFIIREKKNIHDAFLLGLVIYSVFELTNKAIFKKWSWYTVFIDSVWGGILYSITTYLVYKIYGIHK